MAKCKKCGALLTGDETGLNLKLVNRAVTSFLCLECLAAHFKASPSSLLAMADRFREAGCVLFPIAPEELPPRLVKYRMP